MGSAATGDWAASSKDPQSAVNRSTTLVSPSTCAMVGQLEVTQQKINAENAVTNGCYDWCEDPALLSDY